MARRKLDSFARRVWRDGYLRGVEDAAANAEQFRVRASVRGTKADPPESLSEEHPLEALRIDVPKRRRAS